MKKLTFTISYAFLFACLFLIPATVWAQLPIAPKADYSTKTGTFTDTRDGKTYAYKKYGDYDWFVQNLNYVAPGDRGTAPFGSYLYTPGEGYGPAVDPDGSIFGRMYNIRTSTADLDDFCPDGWRLPVKSDWEQLFTDIASEYELSNVTGATNIGKYLKSGGTTDNGGLWKAGTEIDAKSDQIGFNVLPAGVLNYWRRNDTGYDNSTQIDNDGNPRGDHMPGDIASFMLSGWAVNALKATDNNVLFPSNAGTELKIYSHHYGSVRCVRTAAIPTNTAEMEGQQKSKAFFNSNGSMLTVVSSLLVNVISVFDITGKAVFHKQIDQNQLTLEIESNSWNSGIYIIKVQNSAGFESLKVNR